MSPGFIGRNGRTLISIVIGDLVNNYDFAAGVLCYRQDQSPLFIEPKRCFAAICLCFQLLIMNARRLTQITFVFGSFNMPDAKEKFIDDLVWQLIASLSICVQAS